MGLDLSRIEAWSREMLEGEARRRGVRAPEFRTRGELVRLILRHQYGDRFNAGRDRIAEARRNLQQARELVATALGAALTALPEPFDALMRLRNRLPGPSPRRSPVVRVHEPSSPPVIEPSPAPVVAAPVVADVPKPAEPPPRVSPATRTFVEEPIRTRSMARLLAVQGHKERALAIYAELIEQQTESPALREEAEAVRRGDPIEAPVLPAPGAELERPSAPDAGDILSSEGEPSTGLLLRWHITEPGLRRARAVLGSEGELAVRVISIRPDDERVVRSEITEHAPVDASGEWQTPPLAAAVRCFAAAGLRQGDRFVAIVHVHPGAKKKSSPSIRPAATA
ncbi:MAG: hypothetical protein ACHQ53_18475 [Polyangiales bacterium]